MNRRIALILIGIGIIAGYATYEYKQRCAACNNADGALTRQTSTPPRVGASANLPFEWPPQTGHPYPDLELVDQMGQTVRLSSFKGKVLIIEPVGMNCAACLGWSGTEKYGPFKGLAGQQGLHPFEDGFQSVTGLSFNDPRIVQIQLLLFGTDMKPTTAEDAKAWAEHFHRDKAKNQYVLAGSANLHQQLYYQATYNQVPGFQLVDKDFILRSDATSDAPKISLWGELIPQVRSLVEQVKS